MKLPIKAQIRTWGYGNEKPRKTT